MPIDKKVLKKCEEAILDILGNLIDLPYDVANTICNIYYRYFEIFSNESIEDIKKNISFFDDLLFENKENPFVILRINVDSLEDTRKSNATVDSLVAAEFICLNKVVQSIRIFDDPNIVFGDSDYTKNIYYSNITSELLLDIFKYRILKAFDKTPIRRKIERKMKKKINEISNLIDFLNVRFEEEDDDDDWNDEY